MELINMTTAIARRVDALHGTGTDVRGTTNAFDALADAGLAGWNVEKQPVKFADGTALRGVQGLRKGSGYPLHGLSVGDRYNVIQYEQNAELLDAVALETGAMFDSSGPLDGGRKAYLSMRLPDQLVMGDNGDLIDGYIVAFMGHGKVANVFAPTATRVFCLNQQHQITRGNKYKVTIRHTANHSDRMLIARSTLTATISAFRELAEEAEKMMDQRLTDEKFRQIVDGLYPLGGETGSAQTRYDGRMQTMSHLFNESETNSNIRGSVWGGLQSVYEYVEHYATVRGTENGNVTDKRAQRSLVSPTVANERDKAYRAFSSLMAA